MDELMFIIKAKLRNPIRTVLLYFYKLHRISLIPSKKKQIIICFDGFTQHGGFVDRLKGIIAFYQVAKHSDFEFKIHHEFPYDLREFLEPNQYDWIASKNDMKWNPFSDIFHYRMLDFAFNPVPYFQKTNKKKHFVYCNVDYLEKIFPSSNVEQLTQIWSISFHELFKKSVYLESELQKLNLPEKKITIHSRFCSILGDFVDTFEKTFLNDKQQQILLNDLMQNIRSLTTNYTENQIFVFSDSINYLNFVKKNSNYTVLDGEPIHPDNKDAVFPLEQHLKTILDFFVIASCDEIVLMRKEFMYPSAYPKYASYIYEKPFKSVIIK